MTIHPRQIKAARALLDWKQGDLAYAAGLSVTTVRNLESGDMSPRSTTAHEIRKAIENAGLEFIEPDGIKRRVDEIKVYHGPDSCAIFFDDVLQTIKEKGGDVVSIFKSPEAMKQSCSSIHGNFDRLELLSEITTIKCLLSEIPSPLPTDLPFQFRTISKQYIGPASFFVYGNKHAVVLAEGRSIFRFIVYNMSGLAQDYKDHFFSLWNTAPPFFIQTGVSERRAAS